MKKFLVVLLSVMMTLSLASCTKSTSSGPEIKIEANQNPDNADFEKWMNEQFVDSMEDDYFTYHFGISDATTYGIEKPEVTLGEIDDQYYEDYLSDANETLEELKGFDVKTLSTKQLYDYYAIKQSVEIGIKTNSNPLLDQIFLPGQGLTDNLNTNFDEFVFRSKEDIDDYLVLLADVPNYFDQAIAFTQKQVDAGVFMPDYSADETIEGIDDYIAKVDDNALIQSFNDRIDEFEGLTADEVATYKASNVDIIINQVIPAYQKVKDSLVSWKGTNTQEVPGLVNYDGGKEYYEGLFAYKTSSTESVDSVYKKLVSYEKDFISQFQNSMRSNMNAYDEANSYVFPERTPQEILEMHEENMYMYMPYGPEVTYTAEFLDQSIANSSVSAYYLIPPVDNIKDNVIKINAEYNETDPEGMYSTLAHEGFPGHCFQTTYYYASNPNPLRYALSYIGYSEGWAMHAELYSFDWEGFENIETGDFFRLNIVDGYVMPCLVDIGINYYGWTKDELAKELGNLYGSSISGDDIADIYEYIAGRPGSFLPYGVGMMYMQTLHDHAKEELGDKFDEIEYNTIILDNGERSYDVLKADVEQYISQNK